MPKIRMNSLMQHRNEGNKGRRILLFAGDNFKASIEKMPSLFSCATVKEITQFFADGTQSTKRLKLVREQIGSLSLLQKDALVRQLNQVQNTFVKWRTTTEEVRNKKLILLNIQ